MRSFAKAKKKRDIYLLRFIAVASIKMSEKLTRLKIAADNLIVFAGEFFTEGIEDPKVDHENPDPAWQ